MAGGWAKDGAVQEQIDASVEDAVNRARSELSMRESLHDCEECGAKIPDARRLAVAGVRRCIECQGALESRRTHTNAINRRASKDSQLR